MYFINIYIRCFNEYSNSCHEGTNKGIKYNSAPTNGTKPLEHTTTILSRNGERNVDKVNRLFTKDMRSHNTWIDLDSSKYVVEKGINLFINQLNGRHIFESIRISDTTWYIKLIDPSHKGNGSSITHDIIPRFRIIRKVTYTEPYFHCSCGHYERWGMPCRHLLHVLYQFPGYIQPSYFDFDTYWWNSYFMFGTCHNRNINCFFQDMAKDFSSMKDNKKVGTFFIPSLLEGIPITTNIPERYTNQTVDCCNYDITDILKSKNIQINVPAGFSQSSQISNNQNQPYIPYEEVSENFDTEDNLSTIVAIQNDIDDINHSSNCDDIFDIENVDISRDKGVYCVLNPYFKEMIEAMEDVPRSEQVSNIIRIMTEQTAIAKKKNLESSHLHSHPHSNNAQSESSKSIVSCMVPSSKKKYLGFSRH